MSFTSRASLPAVVACWRACWKARPHTGVAAFKSAQCELSGRTRRRTPNAQNRCASLQGAFMPGQA
eukprot:5905678-Alexandrium_andersonii.AAC.1